MNQRRVFEGALLLAAGLPLLAQSGAKGIYLDQGPRRKPAVRFDVQLERGSQKRIVPAGFAFRDGDLMKFRFELNRDGYVYVLHRTIEGPATGRYEGARGIDVIREEDLAAKRRDSFELLFPNQAAGQDNLVRGHAWKTIPEKSSFRMDENPGLEKLLVVISREPLDLPDYFDANGKLKPVADAGGSEAAPDRRADLTRRLLDYSLNAAMDARPKGIELEDDYAAAKEQAKPMLVPVDLKHLPRH